MGCLFRVQCLANILYNNYMRNNVVHWIALYLQPIVLYMSLEIVVICNINTMIITIYIS